ncbi:hypothetical protein V8E36_004529 [Tilletia maclaganii]
MVIHKTLRQHVGEQMANGELCLSESTSSGISKRSASRAAREVRMFGRVVDHKKASGRPTKLPIDARAYLLAYLRRHPCTYQDELAALVNAHFDCGVSRSTINRFLDASGWSLKQLSARDLAQCDEQRDLWMLRVSGLRAEQLVFADESHVNHRTGMRPRGYVPRGERAIEYRITLFYYSYTLRGKKYSLLPALAVDGIFAAWAFEGAVTGGMFRQWLSEHLLPHMNEYPGPRSVLVLDNCSIHKDAETRQLVEDHGCKLLFLPPYSPDYNPIELAFSSIKKHLKRYPAEHEWDLIAACYASITQSTGLIEIASLLRAQPECWVLVWTSI